nr:PGR5-like protein 1A, chloroplastic [Tanacetum cinerariifolium]
MAAPSTFLSLIWRLLADNDNEESQADSQDESLSGIDSDDDLCGLQDLTVDYLKMFLINAPAAVVTVGLFEITYLLELPEPFSFIFTWFAALPFLLWLSFTLTNVIVRDFLILKAVHFFSFYAPLWSAILFQVIRMLNNVTRMAVGMSDLGSQTDTYAVMK